MIFLLLSLALVAVVRASVWIARGSAIAPLPNGLEKTAARISFAAALIVSVALLLAPAYTGIEQTEASPGNGISKSGAFQRTLLQVNGPRVLIYLVLVVVIAGLPQFFARGRWRDLLEAGTATLLLASVILAGFSVGLFYLPSALAMLAAAWAARSTPTVGPASPPNAST